MRRLCTTALAVLVLGAGGRPAAQPPTRDSQQAPPAHGAESATDRPSAASANELWEAARRGDAAAVRRILDAGVDVNTPFRYGATALSYACDRGHLEVVRVLLERGARVDVEDSFYGATPLDWASSPAAGGVTDAHVEIVRLLLQHGASGRERALAAGVEAGHAGLVRAVLAAGKLGNDAMSEALADAESTGRSEIADLLKAAGARPLPPANVVVDRAVLERYVGIYAAEQGPRVEVTLSDDHLMATLPGGDAGARLGAVDQAEFRTIDGPRATVAFEAREGAPAHAIAVTVGGRSLVLARVGPKP
jgi:ankyrin repeat protein